jgi:hypothetical protein
MLFFLFQEPPPAVNAEKLLFVCSKGRPDLAAASRDRAEQSARDAEEVQLDDVSVLCGEIGAGRIVGMTDRRHRRHRLLAADAGVKGEPDDCGGRTCGLMITRDFGECGAVSNGGG